MLYVLVVFWTFNYLDPIQLLFVNFFNCPMPFMPSIRDYRVGYFRFQCYGPILAEMITEPICYNDLIIILTTYYYSLAVNLV